MTYNKELYCKNKERFLEYQRQDRLRHKEMRQQHRKMYDNKPESKTKQKEYKKKYRLKNPERFKELKKKDDAKYYHNHKERIVIHKKQYQKGFYIKNRERILAYGKQHRQLPEVRARHNEMTRIWRKNNPRSNRSLYLELQDAMNAVRIRDNNTCQWQGCGVTHRQTRIDVHHIFPRSEYPDLELVEQYMICYCPNHHSYWHRMRGDPYHGMIYPSHEYMRANPDELLLGGD